MDEDRGTDPRRHRRRVLARAAALAAATDVPQEGHTGVQRTRPPLPDTPSGMVDRGAAPDDRPFARRQRDANPEQVGAATVRLAERGSVGTPPSRADRRDGLGAVRGAHAAGTRRP